MIPSSPRLSRSLQNRQAYCSRHGYGLVMALGLAPFGKWNMLGRWMEDGWSEKTWTGHRRTKDGDQVDYSHTRIDADYLIAVRTRWEIVRSINYNLYGLYMIHDEIPSPLEMQPQVGRSMLGSHDKYSSGYSRHLVVCRETEWCAPSTDIKKYDSCRGSGPYDLWWLPMSSPTCLIFFVRMN